MTIQMPLFETPGAGSGGGAAPTDMGDIIANSIEGLNDDLSREPEETPAAPDPAAKPDDEQELKALEADLRTKNPSMKGSIDVLRHQAVLTRQRTQAEKASQAAVKEWRDKEAAWQKAEADYKRQTEEWKQYEWAKDPEIHNALRAIELSELDQRKFAELLLSDPRYAALLQFKEAKEIPSNRPGPNQRTADGKMAYYDEKGLQALMDWHGAAVAKQVQEELKAQFQREMDERFGKLNPVIEQYELSTAWQSALSTQKTYLQNARDNWPGFKEQEGDCKQFMINNPKASMEDAYREVVVRGGQKSDAQKEAAWRAKFAKEMEEKRRAGSGLKPVTGSGVERVSGNKDEPRDLGDVIRDSIRGLR